MTDAMLHQVQVVIRVDRRELSAQDEGIAMAHEDRFDFGEIVDGFHGVWRWVMNGRGRPFPLGSGDFDEAFQFADARGVTHFAEGLRFDLADPFAGDLELAADFFEGAAVAVLESEALF